MDRNLPNINLDSHTINNWFFAPYKDLDGYDSEDPLYGLVAEFDGIGDVMVYNRSGDVGTYHSVNPEHESVPYHPPSDEFKLAISIIFNNPGSKQDVSSLLQEMYPWEHHQLEVIVNGVNADFEALPKEILAFINMSIDEKFDVEVSDKEEAKQSEYMKLTKEVGEALQDQL